MKIAYIGSFARLYDEEGIALSLEALGHQVIRYPEITFTASAMRELVAAKPDFVLFAKLKLHLKLRLEFIAACKAAGIMTVCWVPDLYFGISRQRYVEAPDVIFQADIVCTPDGGHDQGFKDHGINHKLLRQGIFDSQVGAGKPSDKPFEIVFIGVNNPEFRYREKTMNHLTAKYKKRFMWYGKEYTHEVRGQDLNDLFASVKIVIGDSVYSPHYWSNRIYETLGRGGFLIHPRIPGLEKEFEYYKEMVPYDYGDFAGLEEKIDYYLAHPELCRAAAKRGMERVKNNYTLMHRCQQLLNYVTSK